MRTTGERYIPDPAKYVGRWVQDTSGRSGTVQRAWVEGGVVRLSVLDPTGHDGLFITDHEHATLTRYQGPGVEAVLNPESRVVEWEDET